MPLVVILPSDRREVRRIFRFLMILPQRIRMGCTRSSNRDARDRPAPGFIPQMHAGFPYCDDPPLTSLLGMNPVRIMSSSIRPKAPTRPMQESSA